jgi:hypothetical protein
MFSGSRVTCEQTDDRLTDYVNKRIIVTFSSEYA